MAALAPQGIAICWVTIGELYEGVFGHPNPQSYLATLRQFHKPLTKLDLNDSIMEQFGVLRSTLRRQGKIIADFDILLGATALHYDLTELTRNTRHLTRIPNLKIYKSA